MTRFYIYIYIYYMYIMYIVYVPRNGSDGMSDIRFLQFVRTQEYRVGVGFGLGCIRRRKDIVQGGRELLQSNGTNLIECQYMMLPRDVGI